MAPPSALVSLHLAVALFGLAGLFGRWIDLSSEAIVLGRTLVAAIALALWMRLRGRTPQWDVALAVNGAILAFHWYAFFEAIKLAGVATGLLGFASFPLWTLVLERLSGLRRPTLRDGLVVLLVIGGLALVVPRFDPADVGLHGLAWGVASGASFAWLAVRNRVLARIRDPLVIACGQNAFAAACLVPFVLTATPALPDARTIALLVLLGVVCTALAHTLFIAALARVSAHAASVVAALEPAWGIAFAALLLGEEPTLRQLGGCVLLIGAAIASSMGARAATRG